MDEIKKIEQQYEILLNYFETFSYHPYSKLSLNRYELKQISDRATELHDLACCITDDLDSDSINIDYVLQVCNNLRLLISEIQYHI